MGLLLDFAYVVASVLLSPWILYRLLVARDRQVIAMRFGFALGSPLARSIWLHGSSVGEVSVLKPLVALLERDYPDTPLVISAFTTTGLAAARKLYPRHRVVPFPFELTFVVRRALRRFDPRLVIIGESEFWPNFIRVAQRRGIPVAVVNGKMSAKSYRIHSYTRLIPRALAALDAIAVQTDEHADRIRALGAAPERIHVTGNMKYDLARAAGDPADAEHRRRELDYEPDDVVVIGGSLHEQEDEALLDAYRAALAVTDRAALIIVPRYPADAESVEQHAKSRGFAVVRKTALDRGDASAPGRRGVLIVDTVGELGALYAISDVAFVGGSLFFRGSNKGGHNLMEPAMLAVPVLFGPYNFSFKETVDDLLAADAGRLVRDARELERVLVELVADGARRRELGARGREVVHKGQGATARNYELLIELLSRRGVCLQGPDFDRKMPRAHLDSSL